MSIGGGRIGRGEEGDAGGRCLYCVLILRWSSARDAIAEATVGRG